MSTQEVAELQVLLEGVPLPASKQNLLDHARREGGGSLARLLERLPDRHYESLDDVGEQLLPVQPEWKQPDAARPREESGKPPGGEAYTDASAEPGRVREDGP
jgi:Protein of unknown function (DUF2795)